MSASTNDQSQFSAKTFARATCELYDLKYRTLQCRFRNGWAGIFESFAKEVSGLNIIVNEVNDRFSFLDIEVDMSGTTKAKHIYAEILKAKYTSLATCSYCGTLKDENTKMLCNTCLANAATLKVTGTWLDQF